MRRTSSRLRHLVIAVVGTFLLGALVPAVAGSPAQGADSVFAPRLVKVETPTRAGS